jgi:phthiodiolone/phenolphthiodiolone dimycocerosates ketoreductase
LGKVIPETSVITFGDRHFPIAFFAETIKALAASGVVDDMGMSDQMNSFFPPMLWTTQNTPLAAILPDIDSHAYGQAMLAYATAIAPNSNFSIMTDSIRNPPAELVQAMLTIANITEGRVTYSIGGGEVKQCRPYGWKRSEGLNRMEDLFKIFHLLWNSKPGELVNYEGHHTTLKNASLGSAKRYRPKLWGLGGGPRLLDLVTTYCDGMSIAMPLVWETPEEAAKNIAIIKNMLADKGRDPEKFTFGYCGPVLLHEDPAVIDKALDNTLIRWLAAVFGRVDPADWTKDGLQSPWPEGWNYFTKLVPFDEKPEFVNEVLSKTTRAHAKLSTIHGTPKEVAAKIQPFVDAGMHWVQTVDYLPLILPPEDGARAVGRSIELCAHLKGKAV